MAGSYDLIQQPMNISEVSKQSVCFFMFVDEETERFLKRSSNLDSGKKIGLWRIVIVHNLPYSDPRCNGKGSYQSFYCIDFFPMLGILYGWMGNSRREMEEDREEVKLFRELGIVNELIQAYDSLAWKNPSKIQIEAIPHALQGFI
ncbi:putative RNA helicase [Helianthus annuus]|nr:putative RNA helicase [Helianthus annuus]KAJ0878174.1 putative RNA helicase [Helianthus annuus]KAJ0882451.1 putative RNA helicase [Helianthus annuus]